MARTRKKTSDRAMLTGLLAGSAVGAAIALVYAPAQGDETRKRLLDWAKARLDQITNKAQAALPGGTSKM